MWAILVVIVFLAGQVYLFRSLKKVDGFLARQEEPEEKEILSLVFADPGTAEGMARLLAEFSRENPEVEMVLHTDPAVPEAVREGRAAVGFLPERAGSPGDLRGCSFELAGLAAQRIVWKTGSHAPCTDVFLRYVAQYCGNSERIVL